MNKVHLLEQMKKNKGQLTNAIRVENGRGIDVRVHDCFIRDVRAIICLFWPVMLRCLLSL